MFQLVTALLEDTHLLGGGILRVCGLKSNDEKTTHETYSPGKTCHSQQLPDS